MKYAVIIAGAFVLFSSAAAMAANGYLTDSVHMYAGPSNEYPTVMRLSSGRPVTIHGCVARYSWCDVEWRGNRGWVQAEVLQAGEARVPVADEGPRVGIPEVRFSVQSYWDENYRQRPWYADRAKWYQDDHNPRVQQAGVQRDPSADQNAQQASASSD